MSYLYFLPKYLLWHYSQGFKELLTIFKNFIWVNNHIFQYSFLLKDLFSPLNRLREGKFNIFSLDDLLEFVIVNSIMRFIGFGIRTIVMLFGVFIFILTIIVEILFFLFWITAPFIVLLLLYYGIKFIL